MSAQSVQLVRDYFRRDQRDGISPPDLSKDCTLAEHIVHARGKRTQLTSVSLDLLKIKDFGEADYQLDQAELLSAGHSLIEHEVLMHELDCVVRDSEKADRLRAIQAIRYARRRKEGIVSWKFDVSRVARKELITWAQGRVQSFFRRLV
jgi:hypothetical protein